MEHGLNRFWTDNETSLLIRMAADGRPSSAIALALNKTRSAVMGRVHRLGVKLHGQPPAAKKPRKRPKKKKLTTKTRPARPPVKTKPPAPAPIPEPSPPLPPADGYPFLDVPRGGCLFEIANAPRARDFRFCGRPQAAGPYCAHHAKVVLPPVRNVKVA